MLKTETITIQVTPEAARAYREVSEDERKKMELLLNLRLLEITQAHASLREIMSEISTSAQQKGLTPEILSDLLNQ